MQDERDWAIRTTGLTKYYGSARGIVDIDLSVQRGEIFGFLGPNGAGKTTSIRLLLQLMRPTSGEIFLFGERQRASGRVRVRDIGYLPGEFGLYPDLSGEAHLRHMMKLRGLDPGAAFARNQQRLFERFPLPLDRKVGGYSKGMKQLLGIMQAFMCEPPLLILDEPTSGLDPLMREAFVALLREEQSAGRTVFLSSHNLSEVDRICDRVGIIKDGRLSMVEPIEKHRSAVGKKIRVIPAHLPDSCSKTLAGLSGVEHLRCSSAGIEFLYKGDMQQLVVMLAQMEILDLSSESPGLDDFFLQYYED